MSQELSDQEIITRVNAGEKKLFELLIRKYNTRLFRIGISIVKNDHEMEDVMQNAYIKAYENLIRFEGRANFSTWLIRILINESLAHLKRTSRFTSIERKNQQNMDGSALNELPDNSTPVNETLNRELARILENSVLELPDKYRTVFVIREMEDMNVAETAEILSISESNVKVRLNRAKSILRDRLNKYYRNELVFNFHLSRCDKIVGNVFKHLNIPRNA